MTRFCIALALALGVVSVMSHVTQLVNFLSLTVELRSAIRELEASDMWVETHLSYGDHIYYIKKGPR